MIPGGRAYDAVTLGEAMVVFLADDGTPLRSSVRFRRTVAGAEANVACGLARLGHRVAFLGRVGADAFGQVVRDTLRAYGVDDAAVTVDGDAHTGMLVRDLSGQRPTEVVYARRGSAGSRVSRTDVPADVVAAARVLHVSGITPVLSEDARAATAAAIEVARAAGTAVSFDPNIRRRLCPPERAVELLRPLAGQADLVLTGTDEAELLSGAADRHRQAAWFLDRGARLVVFKAGAAGAWATDGTTEWEQPAMAVHAVDPVGAGDSFAAGLLSGLLRGVPVDRALREATAVAALVVASPGDLEGLPSAGERDAFLMTGSEVAR